jgi:hypothetical protein
VLGLNILGGWDETWDGLVCSKNRKKERKKAAQDLARLGCGHAPFPFTHPLLFFHFLCIQNRVDCKAAVNELALSTKVPGQFSAHTNSQ